MRESADTAMPPPVTFLTFNAGLQVLVSSLLGLAMLAPMQPWGARLRKRWNQKSLLATHLDLYMQAFLQWGAAFTMVQFPSTATVLPAWLLVFGGWVNPLPYFLRGFGINGFALAGGPVQLSVALLGGLSVSGIIVAWALILARLWAAM